MKNMYVSGVNNHGTTQNRELASNLGNANMNLENSEKPRICKDQGIIVSALKKSREIYLLEKNFPIALLLCI